VQSFVSDFKKNVTEFYFVIFIILLNILFKIKISKINKLQIFILLL